MKKIGLIAAAITFTILSCKKDDLPPVDGYNSKITFDNITFYNPPSVVDSIVGTVDFLFAIDTTDADLDTVAFTEHFTIPTSPYDQEYHFNTPAKTKTANFRVTIEIYDNVNHATADSVNIASFSYKRDGTTLFNKAKYFNKNGGLFTSSWETYTFQ